MSEWERENLQRLRREVQYIFQDAEAVLDPRQTIGSAIAEPLLAKSRLLDLFLSLQQQFDLTC